MLDCVFIGIGGKAEEYLMHTSLSIMRMWNE
jgi:hypothetical protein